MVDSDFMDRDKLHIIVSKNIKKLRKQKGLTQSQLAEEIGISHEYLRQIESEKGQNDFSLYTLYKISVVLKIGLDVFIQEQ